ncbi:MAG TPA: hypothetical protein VHZ74_01365 [Bryobacteraceae bacterium]|nr:hypothetical protein [Bryobacteraceae bacterium]
MISRSHQFRELFRLFRQRFVESDALAPDADFNTNLWQLLGLVAVPGLYAAGMMMSMLLRDVNSPPLEVRFVRIFFAAYSFTVSGFATLFEWDMLFPDRRDFLVLTLFPVRLWELFAAKMAALGVLLGVLAMTINGGALGILLLILVMNPRAHSFVFLEATVLFIVSSVAASAFGFLLVAGLQGLLINITSVRFFRRISPSVQMAGMSAMVIALVLFPIYANVWFVAVRYPAWMWRFPPYWFAGMQEIPGHRPDALLQSLGAFGWKAFGLSLLFFAAMWGVGFARHYRRTLEAEDSAAGSLRDRRSWFDWMLRGPEERAIFYFGSGILARSTKHRLFLACYLSVGLALGLVLALRLDATGLHTSAEGLRALPFLLTFFVVSGLRAGFQFPSELAANWAFQIAGINWNGAARNASRKLVIVRGLLPVLTLLFPLEVAGWGFATGLLHMGVQAAAGALLTELLFWSFDKVPFTCSYFPGRVNMALLAGLYLYGFSAYSFKMADLETLLDRTPLAALLAIGVVAGLLALLWRREPADYGVRFDGSEPDVQTLNLS